MYYRAYYSSGCIGEQDLMSDLNPALEQTIAEFYYELVVTHPIFAKLPRASCPSSSHW